MAQIWGYFSAIASRMIFVIHSVYCLHEILKRIYIGDSDRASNSPFWGFTIVLGLILIEGSYTIVIRKGNEYKYFWPSGLIYIIIMIVVVCLLELHLMDEEIKCSQVTKVNVTSDQVLKAQCDLISSVQKDDQKLRAAVEIGMLGALVVGRWLLPRGELTRDQLSALLLNFISNGADSIEFLNTWNDFPVLRLRNVTNTVLVLFSLSMLQFAVLTTRTTDEYNNEEVFMSEPQQNTDGNGNQGTYNRKSSIPLYIEKLVRKKQPRKGHHLSSRRNDWQQCLDNYQKSNIKNTSNKHAYASEQCSVQPAARHLQNLARNGRWDEFSEVLQQAKTQGFSGNSSISQRQRLSSLLSKGSESNDMNDTTESVERQSVWVRFKQHLDQDIFQTVILMVSLEIPYLIARVVFAVVYNVSSTTMVFYTTKNIVMVIFLTYRLWVIIRGSSGKEEKEINDGQTIKRDVMNIK